MEAKMSAHPELEKLAEQAELTGNGGPFFMEHIDLVEKYMTEIFLANGNSPQISDFVVSVSKVFRKMLYFFQKKSSNILHRLASSTWSF